VNKVSILFTQQSSIRQQNLFVTGVITSRPHLPSLVCNRLSWHAWIFVNLSVDHLMKPSLKLVQIVRMKTNHEEQNNQTKSTRR